MKKPNLFIVHWLFISLLFIGACSKKTDFGGTSTDPSVNGANDVAPSNNYLWVHHKSEIGALRYTHKNVTSGTWPDACKIDLDTTDASARDILCTTESNELDLFHMGMTLMYNVPAHAKCPYVVTMAPFFFQHQPPMYNDAAFVSRYEPAYVYVIDDQDNPANSKATGYYDDFAFVAGAPTGTVNSNLDWSGSYYKCKFDYTTVKGPNCCGSYYSEYRKTISGGTTTFSTSYQNWGGHQSNCLSGPAMELNTGVDGVTKWPAIKIWRMKDQIDSKSLKLTADARLMSPIDLFSDIQTLASGSDPKAGSNFGSFEVTSLIDKKFGTNRYLANYYKGTAPAAFSEVLQNPANASATLYSLHGQPSYFTVSCVDQNWEMHARIRLQVREWNTYAALKNATEPTADEDDDSTLEPTPFPDHPNADLLDWEESTGWQSGIVGTGKYPGFSF